MLSNHKTFSNFLNQVICRLANWQILICNCSFISAKVNFPSKYISTYLYSNPKSYNLFDVTPFFFKFSTSSIIPSFILLSNLFQINSLISSLSFLIPKITTLAFIGFLSSGFTSLSCITISKALINLLLLPFSIVFALSKSKFFNITKSSSTVLLSRSFLKSTFGFVFGKIHPSNTLITYNGDPPHKIGNLFLFHISFIFLFVCF